MSTIIPGIIVLGLLVIVHEFGHFVVAKLTGIGVETFSIGFGPRIFGRKSKGTDYRVSAFPLGGYVKMVGESLDEEEVLEPEDVKRSFSHKPVPIRILVVAAGPIFNLILAVLIYSGMFMTGIDTGAPVIGQVSEGSPAAAAGFMSGDRIISMDGVKIEMWEEVVNVVYPQPGRTLAATVLRDGQEVELMVTPEEVTEENIFGEDMVIGRIGVTASGETIRKSYGPVRSLGLGIERTWDVIALTFVALGKIFQGVVPANSLGGPVMIFQMAGEQAKQGIMSLVLLVSFLSIMLGVFNLLPIPILDGGHILFFALEGIRGKPLSIRKREIIQQVGLVVLLSIFLFAFYNDITRIFIK